MDILQKLSKSLNVDLKEIESKIQDSPTKHIVDIKTNYENLIDICKSKFTSHPDWLVLSGRLRVEQLKLTVCSSFSKSTEIMKEVLLPSYYEFVEKYSSKLDAMIEESRDYSFDLFGIDSLINSQYLCRLNIDNTDVVVETPQYMYLRVSIFLWYTHDEKDKIFKRIVKTYEYLSLGYISLASPVLYNSGYIKHQLSSCFQLPVEDNMESIAELQRRINIISSNSGGLGIDLSSLRETEIAKKNNSEGVKGWAEIIDTILKVVNQRGKRPGAATCFITDWHISIEYFIHLRDRNSDILRHKKVNLAIMISDEFMRRVESDGTWTLMCPNKAKGLTEVWGTEFEKMYSSYEDDVRNKKIPGKIVKARELMNDIIISLINNGMPFIGFVDSINRKSNQSNLSNKIKMLNLCMEMTLNTTPQNIPSCNLGAICVNKCVKIDKEGKNLDVMKIVKYTSHLTKCVNRIIDINHYPDSIPEIKDTNLKNRPIGLGVCGFADLLARLDVSFEDDNAKIVNELMMESIYYSSLVTSMNLAKKYGKYETFGESPLSKGIFQFDMWDKEKLNKQIESLSENNLLEKAKLMRVLNQRDIQKYFNWNDLRENIMTHGVRNSYLTAIMPTASTAQIRGCNESIEPYTSNIYTRTTTAGQYVVMNRHMVNDLMDIGMWNHETALTIVRDRGSIQNISGADEKFKDRLTFLKSKYKTAFELSQKILLDLSLKRGEYVCQSESHNVWMKDATVTKVMAYLFAAWKGGSKTPIYYLHNQGSDTINYSAEHKKLSASQNVECDDDSCCRV